MSGLVKTKEEIEKMRAGGKILAEILDEVVSKVEQGVTTAELDQTAEALCKKHGVVPAFKGYQDYPAILCVGVDDVAIHGIPSEEEILIEGQTISIDMGIIYQDMYLDHAKTVGVGKIDPEGEKLLRSTELAMKAGIAQATEGKATGDIGFAMEQVADMAGLSVITAMTGHGVGRQLHEEPSIPCFGERGKGTKLKAGMTLAIEAMINEGGSELEFLSDGWTTVTKDGMRSAIFEHTVLVGKKTPEILTIR